MVGADSRPGHPSPMTAHAAMPQKKPKKTRKSPPKPSESASQASARRKRQIFAEGHRRKFLVVVDETPECESALAFAASRAQRTGGQLALLYVIEPDVDFQWLAVEEVAREEGHS